MFNWTTSITIAIDASALYCCFSNGCQVSIKKMSLHCHSNGCWQSLLNAIDFCSGFFKFMLLSNSCYGCQVKNTHIINRKEIFFGLDSFPLPIHNTHTINPKHHSMPLAQYFCACQN